jgi:2-polyprenyl-3-methyl-5-hydroxy-6-metoxy-1,4-benzoquinol methylase
MVELDYYLKKMVFLSKIPILRKLVFKFLISRNSLTLSNISFKTKYQNSYSLISEKISSRFQKIMNRLECYIGTGPIGPNKYWEYPWILANLKLKKGMSILDVGCGKSPIQFLLADLGCNVYAIDPNENVEWHGINRKLAKLFNCNIEYRKEGGESISYHNNTFDRVCCISVIEHCNISIQRKILAEMIRVLKPGGLCVITVDYAIPRSKDAHNFDVDVADLIKTKGVEFVGSRNKDAFPGEPNFNYITLIENSDVSISSYTNVLTTSIGLTLRKKDKF